MPKRDHPYTGPVSYTHLEGAFVERISSFLELDKQEHEMLLDLAADSRQTVPADLPDYIRQHDIVREMCIRDRFSVGPGVWQPKGSQRHSGKERLSI